MSAANQSGKRAEPARSGGESVVDLAALRALAQTATQGPWIVEDGDGEHVIWMLKEDESRGCFGPQHQIEWRHGLYPGESTETTWGDGEQWAEVDATARYIAAMNPWMTLALLDALEDADSSAGVREAARAAKSLSAAPDYDEVAIRDALWNVVNVALASTSGGSAASEIEEVEES